MVYAIWCPPGEERDRRGRACGPLGRLSLCAKWMLQNKTQAGFSVSYLDMSVLPLGFDGSNNGRGSEDEDDNDDTTDDLSVWI